jgi:hypothetical protein
LEDVRYEMRGRMTVYYYIPILTIARNGLSYDEIDTTRMTNFVELGNIASVLTLTMMNK